MVRRMAVIHVNVVRLNANPLKLCKGKDLMVCKKCNDTGIIETGNNDLPCECSAGDVALFNDAEYGLISGKALKFNLEAWRKNNHVKKYCKYCGQRLILTYGVYYDEYTGEKIFTTYCANKNCPNKDLFSLKG
jgi:hypothetical protein